MYSTTSELFSHIQLSVAPATGWLGALKMINTGSISLHLENSHLIGN